MYFKNILKMQINLQNSTDYFLISAEYYDVISNITWYRNAKGEITSKKGKLLKFLAKDDFLVRQKPSHLTVDNDYTITNLEYTYARPYKFRECIAIPLTGKLGFGESALVDEFLLPQITKVKWRKNKGGYAESSLGLMHRYVMTILESAKAIENMMVDHIDGNRLNNTKANLRIVTSKQNAKNRTSNPELYEGVEKLDNGKFACKIKNIIVYEHHDARHCALCYDSVVTYVYGEGKRLNDNKSRKPLPLSYWQLKPTIIKQLDKLKNNYTDKHGVKATSKGQWKASITLDLGTFDTPEAAARAYDIAVILFKTKADLNNSPSDYSAQEVKEFFNKILM